MTRRLLGGFFLVSVLASACGGGAGARSGASTVDTPPGGVMVKTAPASVAPGVHAPPTSPPQPADVSPAPNEPPPTRPPLVRCDRQRQDGYRRGKRIRITTVSVDGRAIEVATADAFVAMAAAARDDGVALSLYSGFRSMQEQRYFYRCYRTCSCNSCNKAARPGFSNHQSGVALDIGLGQGVHDWLVANAAHFGFRSTIPSEPWHWVYRKRSTHDFVAVCPAGGATVSLSARGTR